MTFIKGKITTRADGQAIINAEDEGVDSGEEEEDTKSHKSISEYEFKKHDEFHTSGYFVVINDNVKASMSTITLSHPYFFSVNC